ncbi:MAG: hypothetical protein K9H26_19470 [Prolixibacteraceae bacterium]|nr:hypothetical protein [Prolixibacteraceae bacterium]
MINLLTSLNIKNKRTEIIIEPMNKNVIRIIRFLDKITIPFFFRNLPINRPVETPNNEIMTKFKIELKLLILVIEITIPQNEAKATIATKYMRILSFLTSFILSITFLAALHV